MGQCLNLNSSSIKTTQVVSSNHTSSQSYSFQRIAVNVTEVSRQTEEWDAFQEIIENNGNSVYGPIALSNKWMDQWLSYINNESNNIPGKIDNSSLDDGDGKTKLEAAYGSDHDYVGVNEEIWQYFYDIC